MADAAASSPAPQGVNGAAEQGKRLPYYLVDSTKRAEYLWERYSVIKRRCLLGLDYHRSRERFFVLLERSAKLLSLVASGSAAFRLVPVDAWPFVLLIVAGASGASIVFSWGDAARKHAEWAVAYGNIRTAMSRTGARHFSEADLDQWEAERREVESSEYKPYRALVCMIEREHAIAEGHPDHVMQMPWYKRCTAHVISWHVPASR